MNMLFVLSLFVALSHYASGAERCCPDVGCFNDNRPFNGLPLPKCPAEFKLNYRMYTRTNRIIGQDFDIKGSLPSAYVTSRRTVFIAHGWTQSGDARWMDDMKDAFLDREDINAVILDWGGGADDLNYNQAAMNTRSVGAYTALVIQHLLTKAGASSTRMWCTGHSLGSHVCGHTGAYMPANQKLGKITGMDPAGPTFEGSSDKTIGLNPSCATFVDILHTARDYGTTRDIGHIDHYPSGGHGQPGCLLQDFSDETFKNWDVDTPEQYDLCDHSRAYQFMTESIKKDCFAARQKCTNYNILPGSCSNCVCGNFPCAYMGYGADSGCQKAGIFYLTVSRSSPYCEN